MRLRWPTVVVLFAVFVEIAGGVRAAQNETDKSSFLIARRELKDPLFEKSVVLMLPLADNEVVVGLIVNRPARVPLREVFPKNSAFKNRSDTVYFGGPVDIKTPGALLSKRRSTSRATSTSALIPISSRAF
jgi:putative AlgH/UPF0301 family transcriptional regulator